MTREVRYVGACWGGLLGAVIGCVGQPPEGRSLSPASGLPDAAAVYVLPPSDAGGGGPGRLSAQACGAPPAEAGQAASVEDVWGVGGQELVGVGQPGSEAELDGGTESNSNSPGLVNSAAPVTGTDAAVAEASSAGVRSGRVEVPTASAGSSLWVDGGLGTGGSAAVGQGTLDSVPGPGDVRLAELMPDPQAVPDTRGEWLELYNATERPIDLQGCVLRFVQAELTLPLEGPWQVEPAGRLTVARHADAGFTPDRVLALRLRNDAEVVRLQCGSADIDQLAYGDGAPQVLPGVALMVDAADLLGPVPPRVCSAQLPYVTGDLGTPGAPNGRCLFP